MWIGTEGGPGLQQLARGTPTQAIRVNEDSTLAYMNDDITLQLDPADFSSASGFFSNPDIDVTRVYFFRSAFNSTKPVPVVTVYFTSTVVMNGTNSGGNSGTFEIEVTHLLPPGWTLAPQSPGKLFASGGVGRSTGTGSIYLGANLDLIYPAAPALPRVRLECGSTANVPSGNLLHLAVEGMFFLERL